MRKTILMLMLAAVSSSAAAQEIIKLECNVSKVLVSTSGGSENERLVADVEVTIIDKYTAISVTGGGSALGSVTNMKTPKTNVTDLSTSDRWEITNTSGDVDSQNQKTTRIRSITIDRNTGSINARSDLILSEDVSKKLVVITVTISGSCKKVDTTKKKF